MTGIFICPGERPAVAFLAHSCPLVNLRILGESVLGYWLEHAACLGWKEIKILTTDRPEQVRAMVGTGARWGLKLEVIPEMREPTVAQAIEQYGIRGGCAGLPHNVILADHLPGLPQFRLFSSYAVWFQGALAWIPHVIKRQRLGLREVQPGVWVGLRTQIDPTAILKGPCWVGESVTIGAEAVIGPNAILEDRVVVERSAEVVHSAVGPETFVGELTKLENSIAWGSMLLNWQSGSCTTVPDAFLLSPLNLGQAKRPPGSWGDSRGFTLRNALSWPWQIWSRGGDPRP